MKRLTILSMIFMLIAVTLLADTVETTIYQGVLIDENGNNLADGTYSITFNIYDAMEEGNIVWTEVLDVDVVDGYFRVTLGEANPLTNLPVLEEGIWLEISVSGQSILINRKNLVLR